MLPVTHVLYFQALAKEISKRESIDFLDFKIARIFEKMQNNAVNKDWEIAFTDSLSNGEYYLFINKDTDLLIKEPKFIATEFYLYGEIYQEGGKKPNLHIVTEEYGNLTVTATKEQLTEGEQKLYKVYGIKASGKQSLEDGHLFDLKLEEFLTYNPRFDKKLLDNAIEKASKNLSAINDVDKWIKEIRGGVYE